MQAAFLFFAVLGLFIGAIGGAFKEDDKWEYYDRDIPCTHCGSKKFKSCSWGVEDEHYVCECASCGKRPW